MKQIYKIGYKCPYEHKWDNEAYFDSEDLDLILKIKNHLDKRMCYNKPLDVIDSITKNNFESVIYNLGYSFDAEIIDLE